MLRLGRELSVVLKQIISVDLYRISMKHTIEQEGARSYNTPQKKSATNDSANTHKRVHRPKSMGMKIKPATIVMKDFFGRPIEQKALDAVSTCKYPTKKKKKKKKNDDDGDESEEENKWGTRAGDQLFHYKFHEGFSNAVRRSVYVHDFV